MLRSAVFLRTAALRAPTTARTTTTAAAAAAAAALSRTAGRFAPSRAIWTRAPAARLRLGSQVRAYSAGGALSRQDVEDRIVGLLRGFDKVNDPSKITSSSHFANDLGLDSLDTVEVVMAIEEEFSIEIPDKDADAIHSVGQAIEYIINQPDAH